LDSILILFDSVVVVAVVAAAAVVVALHKGRSTEKIKLSKTIHS
jgi:hypothetical protein